MTWRSALALGLLLSQGGEFGFVLLALAQQSGLVSPALLNPILASMVLSMLATPFIIMYSNQLVMRLDPGEWLQQSLQMTTIARKSINTSQHVIICGYGRCGQNVARMLDREGIPYMALDLDPDRVRQAAAAGDSVVFGDATRLQALMAAGLVDRVQVTLFPVITGQTGVNPVFQGAADFDLELLEHRTLDEHIQELVYRPTLH